MPTDLPAFSSTLTPSAPWRQPVVGTPITVTTYAEACDLIAAWAGQAQACYIVAANVHVVMMARWQPAYRQVLGQAAMVTADGMPLVWALRLLGQGQASRVYGPDLMLAWCDRTAQLGLPIYLYGGTPEMLAQLQVNLQQQFPTLQIAGAHSPPFRPLTPAETAADLARIRSSGAKVAFIGLGCPKQEYWMAEHSAQLPLVLIGVGAAFSFHSGIVAQAPRWMMRWGLEWLYRLSQEPQRLWKRYLINNPAFVLLFLGQLLGRFLGHTAQKLSPSQTPR